jgi:hypothetical protein
MFGFGEDDSAQRRRQMLQVYQMEQQRQAQQLAAQPPAPVQEPTGDPEGYLNARLGSAGLGGDAANRLAGIYRASLNANPKGDVASLYNQAFETAQGDVRNSYLNRINDQYGTDYSTRTFADTADDPIINAMLGKQRLSAQEGIDRAKSRGQLNTAGLNAATGSLGELESRGRAEANQLGGGVLSRYRQNLDEAIGSLRNRANTASLGGSFDLEGGVQDINNRVYNFQQSLGGDVKAALGDRNFINLGDILGRAGAEQGMVNPGKAPVVGGQTDDEKKKRQVQSAGVF